MTAGVRWILVLRPVHIVAATVTVALAAAGTYVVSAAGPPEPTIAGSNPAGVGPSAVLA